MAVIRTPAGFLSFPALTTPRLKPNGPVYCTDIIFDEEAQNSLDFSHLKATIKNIALSAHGKTEGVVGALRRCADKDHPFYQDVKNGLFISCWSKIPPEIVDANLDEWNLAIPIYAGSVARLGVSVYSWTDKETGKPGVSCGLNAVQVITASESQPVKRVSAKELFSDSFAQQPF